MNGDALELAVVIPTYKERDNIVPLLQHLEAALAGIRWEVIFVDDDSPDGTVTEAQRLAVQDSRVRVIRRVGRRGLASACIEGMLATPAPYIAAMDDDVPADARV